MSDRISKPWGWEEIVEQNPYYVVKKIFMKALHQCSRQYHEYKTETIYILVGHLTISIGNGHPLANSCIYVEGQHITIPNKTIHRMSGKTDCLYLECSTPELDDVVRIEDDYGRIDEN